MVTPVSSMLMQKGSPGAAYESRQRPFDPRIFRGSNAEEPALLRVDQRSLGYVSLMPKICNVSRSDESEI